MRVLIAHNRYQQPGGEDQVVRAEAAMLRHHGLCVEELAFDNEGIHGITGQLRAAANSFFSPSAYRRVQQAIRLFQPDLLHIHNFMPTLSPAVFFAGRHGRVPIVQTLHNYRLICAKGTLYRDGRPCEKCSEQNSFLPGVALGCYRGSRLGSAVVGGTVALHASLGTWQNRVDRYIALTEFAAEKLGRQRVPFDRVRVKPNFVPDRGTGSGDQQVALFVGRLSEEKGIGTLLAADAAHALPLPVVIVGDGPLREQVKAACARPGSRLTAVGHENPAQVLERMKRAAVLLVPSVWYEGFPVSVVEALSVGVPVIASNLGGLPEIVPHGECGLLHAPGDAASLVEALHTFQAMPAEQKVKLRITSRKRYMDRYSEGINYAQLNDIYAQAITAAAHHPRQPVRLAAKPAARPDEAETNLQFGR